MGDTPTAEKSSIVMPAGEWYPLFALEPRDRDGARLALAEDFAAVVGVRPEVTFDPADSISGLGVDTQFFELNLADVIQLVAVATPVLAAMGKRVYAWLDGMRVRLCETVSDEIEAGQLQPLMGAPIMKLLAASSAMDDDSRRAEQITEWESRPVFMEPLGWGVFHAQQKYIVTGRGGWTGYVAVFDAWGAVEFSRWI